MWLCLGVEWETENDKQNIRDIQVCRYIHDLFFCLQERHPCFIYILMSYIPA